MFTSAYFKDHYRHQTEKIGFDAIARLHLLSGETYIIHKVGEITQGYVLLSIYPIEVEDVDSLEKAKAARMRADSSEPIFDQIAVSYENISHVTFTVQVPTAKRVGFNERPPSA